MSKRPIPLVALLLFNSFPGSVFAQDATALQIFISEGDGAIHTARQRPARDPLVLVEDQDHRPIAGAAVVFFLPNQGPGGTFNNGSTTLTVTTNVDGQAAARGILLNAQTGPMQIRVTASYRGLTANATINQTVTLGTGAGGSSSTSGGGSAKKWIIILAIVGGAAAGGAAALSGGKGGGSSNPGTPTITLTPGTVTIGGPQ